MVSRRDFLKAVGAASGAAVIGGPLGHSSTCAWESGPLTYDVIYNSYCDNYQHTYHVQDRRTLHYYSENSDSDNPPLEFQRRALAHLRVATAVKRATP